ncbi:MAG: HAD family acid phosphatase [Chthoniobacterales bacterium]
MKSVFRHVLSALLLAVLSGCCTTPRNLSFVKDDLTRYHDECYGPQFSAAANRARNYLTWRAAHLRPGEKAGVVFDIDETALSNWPGMQVSDYSMAIFLFEHWANRAICPVLPPTLAIYKEARRAGMSVFFISGRPEVLRAATERNLRRAGYTDYARLYLRPMKYDQPSIIPFKSAQRKAIEAKGYHIVLNIGDQWSDLKGGYAERTFKLPNPFYFIP